MSDGELRRWSHLPGGGLGPVQPKAHRRALVGAKRLVRPVVLFGFMAFAVGMAWRFLPELVSFGGVR